MEMARRPSILTNPSEILPSAVPTPSTSLGESLYGIALWSYMGFMYKFIRIVRMEIGPLIPEKAHQIY